MTLVKFLGGRTTGRMPHASIVTGLCTVVRVRWYGDEPVQSAGDPIDDAFVDRMVEWPGGVPHPKVTELLVLVVRERALRHMFLKFRE